MKRRAVALVLLAVAILAGMLALVLRPPMAVIAPWVDSWLARQVKAATGRDLVIKGATSLAVFPRGHLRLEDIVLSGPKGNAGEPLLKAGAIEVTTDIWPLLRGGRELAVVHVERAELALATDNQGAGSWEFNTPATASSYAIGTLEVSGGSLSYRDARSGAASRITGIDGKLSGVREASVAAFSLKTGPASVDPGPAAAMPAADTEQANIEGEGVSTAGITRLSLVTPQLKLRSAANAATFDGLSLKGDGVSPDVVAAVTLKADAVRYGSSSGAIMAARAVDATASALGMKRVGTMRAAADRLGIAEGEARPTFELAKVEASSAGGGYDGPLATDIGFDWNKERIKGRVELANAGAIAGDAPLAAKASLAAKDSTFDFDGTVGTTPELAGNATFTSKSVRALAQWMGSELPKGAGFGPARLSGKIEAKAHRIAFNDAELALDDSKGKGALVLDLSGARPKLSGNLAADRLNVDAYLGKPPARHDAASSAALEAAEAVVVEAATPPPVSLKDALKAYLMKQLQVLEQPAASAGSQEPSIAELNSVAEPAAGATPGATLEARTHKAAAPTWSDAPIDLSGLRRVDVDMTGSIAKLMWDGIEIQAPDVRARLDDGMLAVETNAVGFKGSKVSGRTTIDARAASPHLASTLAADGIEARDVFNALGITAYIAGKSSIEASLEGSAASQKALMESVSGDVKVRMAKGSIVGYDFSDVVGAFFEWLNGTLGYDSRRHSPFDKLEAAMKLTNGVAKSDAMHIDGPVISLISNGTAKLPVREIDYHARISLAAWFKPIAVRIFGEWDKPSKAVDVFDYARNAGALASPLEAFKKTDLKDPELAAMLAAVLEKSEAAGRPLTPAVKELLSSLKDRAEGRVAGDKAGEKE